MSNKIKLSLTIFVGDEGEYVVEPVVSFNREVPPIVSRFVHLCKESFAQGWNNLSRELVKHEEIATFAAIFDVTPTKVVEILNQAHSDGIGYRKQGYKFITTIFFADPASVVELPSLPEGYVEKSNAIIGDKFGVLKFHKKLGVLPTEIEKFFAKYHLFSDGSRTDTTSTRWALNELSRIARNMLLKQFGQEPLGLDAVPRIATILCLPMSEVEDFLCKIASASMGTFSFLISEDSCCDNDWRVEGLYDTWDKALASYNELVEEFGSEGLVKMSLIGRQ